MKKKASDFVTDNLPNSPSKQSVESSLIVSKSGSREMGTTKASFFYENCFLSMLLIHEVLHR